MALPTVDNVTRPRAEGFHCRINNNFYRCVVTPDTPMQRSNAELQAPRVDQATNPEDVSQAFGVTYSRVDFSGGEGLRLAHLSTNPENAETMFWDSLGIETNPSETAQRSNLQLLKDVDSVFSSVNANLYMAYDRPNERLYFSDGTAVKYTDNPFGSPPTITTEDPHAGDATQNVQDIAFFDEELYVALGTSGLHRRDNTGTYTEIDALVANRVWNVKQRIIWGSSNALYELTDAGAGSSTLRLTTEIGYSFNDACDIGSEILVSCTDGYIYSLTLDEETNELAVAGRFSISGEVPAAITSLDGIVLLTTYQQTSNGGYVARVWLVGVQGGNLANRQLVKEFGTEATNIDYRVIASTTKRNRAFLGVRESDRTHLWRYDYSSGGITRDMGEPDYQSQVTEVIPVQSKMFWAVSGSGIYRESNSNVTSGYLISPLGSNFTRDFKSWASITADVEEVAGGDKIEIWYSTDEEAIYNPNHDSWIKGKDIQTVAGGRSRTLLRGVYSRYIALKIVITGGVATTPVLNSFTIGAYPGEADILWNLPVNVSDVITAPFRGAKRIKGLGRQIENSLRSLQGSSVELEILDPSETLTGTIINVEEPFIYNPRRGSSPMFIAQVTFRGRRSPVTGEPSDSPAALGVGMLGVMKLGGIE